MHFVRVLSGDVLGAWQPLVFIFVLFSLVACDPDSAPDEVASNYHSMWSELYPTTLQNDYSMDTLQGAFQYAAAAKSPLEAKDRWSEFLAQWDSKSGEFEDAMHANLVAWAKLEQQRVEVLSDAPDDLKLVNEQLRSFAAQME